MKEPRAMNCATLWNNSCPEEKVSSRGSDMSAPDNEKMPDVYEVFWEVDHICQACEVYEPEYRHKDCAKNPLRGGACPEDVVVRTLKAHKRDLPRGTYVPDYEKVEAVCQACEVFEPIEGN